MATKDVKLLALQLKRIPDDQRYSYVRDSFDSIHRQKTVHYGNYCRQIDSYNDDLSNACRQGDKGAVEQILAQANVVTDEQLQRLVEVSAAENQVEIIKHVLHRIREGRQNQFNTAAFIAAYRGKQEGLSSLLNHGMVSNSVVDTEFVDSLLHIAADQNKVKVIEEVYKRNTSLAKKLNKAGIAPLHVAVASGHQEVTEYLLENVPCSPALIVSAKGNTALHCACQNNQEAIAEYLITQSTPDFLTARNEEGFLPIHFAATQGNVRMVKLLSEYMERNRVSGNSKGGPGNSWTPLHCAAEAGHVEVAKFYCSQRKFKPESCTKENPLSPLHSAAVNGKRVMLEYLLRSGKFRPDMPSRDFGRCNILHLAAYHGHTSCCQLVIDDYNLSPTETAGNNFTAIHLAAASGSLPVTKYFVETKGCSPAVCNSDKATPLHLAAYNGKAKIVTWLLSTGKCDPNSAIPILKVTPLHLAASEEHLACVQAITAHKACNPNAKDMIGMPPLLNASSDAICWELIKAGATPTFKMNLPFIISAQTDIPEFFERTRKYRFLQSWSAILPSVRLFVVGASEAGKSTLVKSLQEEDHWFKGRFIPVEGVEMHTSGVIAVNYESSAYGKVTIYDFAGHEEYYSSHEALLDKTGHSLPIFLIVVDLQNEKEELKRQITYWRSFIKQATFSSNVEPMLMVLGSHCDLLRQQDKSFKEAFLQDVCQSDEGTRFLTIDCRMPASSSMKKLRDILHELCSAAKSLLHIHRYSHAFAAFLNHTIEIACQRYDLERSIDVYGPPVTDLKKDAEKLLENLNSCGYILYLVDRNNIGESWIILDQETILQGIHGYQKRVKVLDSNLTITITGIASFEELKYLFTIPGCDIKLVVRYLVHMEFCHEIDNQEILKSLTKGTSRKDGRYFFFPDLVEAEAPLDMWLEDEIMTCYSGFVFRCHSHEDFISPRFVQVLLLRIALDLCATATKSNEEIFLKNCSLWKNGIHWANLGVETIVELTEGRRSLLVVCRSDERNKMDLVRHRTAVLEMVSEVAKRFPRLSKSLDKLVIHPRNCQPRPTHFDDQQVKVYSFNSILRSLTVAKRPEQQHVHRAYLERRGSNIAASQCHIDDLLYFEPYSLVKSDELVMISQWRGQVSEEWVNENIATYNMSKWREAATMLNVDEATIGEISIRKQSASSSFRNTISEWLNNFNELPSFDELLSILNKYSIFREEDFKQV